MHRYAIASSAALTFWLKFCYGDIFRPTRTSGLFPHAKFEGTLPIEPKARSDSKLTTRDCSKIFAYVLLRPVAQARFAEAERLLERSLAIREKVLGSEHPDVAVSVSTYAGLLTSRVRILEICQLIRRDPLG